MAHVPLSLTVSKHTTSAEIACFLQQAREKVCRPDAGLRARHGVGADGKHDGTVVLYVRSHSGSNTLDDRVALLVDDVKAFFKAKEEYRLAAVTLLGRAEAAKFQELGVTDETRLCATLADALNGKSLTLENMKLAWSEAFPGERRIECRSYLNTFRNDVAVRKRLPDTRQKNGQAPGQVVEKGLSELFYLEALLSVSFDDLGRFERQHLNGLFQHLGQPVTDESLCDMKDSITSLIHVACLHKENKGISSACLAANSAADVEHIKTSVAFARTWIRGWVDRPERGGPLRYNHILALDYLACLLLTTYQPESEASGHAQQLLTKIIQKERGDNYRSVRVVLEAKFVNWLGLGKPAHAFFTGKQIDMSWAVSDTD